MNNNNQEFDPTAARAGSDWSQTKPAPAAPAAETPVAPAPVAPVAPAVTAAPAAPAVPAMKADKVAELKSMQIPNVKDQPFGDATLSDEALRVKEILAKEAKMPIFIPLEPGEKPGVYRSVTINGYRCEVKKGMMVQLPMSIAKLLMDAYQIESEVLNNNEYNLANKDQATRNALNA